jgi:DNA-binding transcriptional MerR regulator
MDYRTDYDTEHRMDNRSMDTRKKEQQNVFGGAPAYTIGDLAREYGITLRALRFYEDRGLLNPTRIGTTRIYTARDKDCLRTIIKGKQLGFTLTEIRAMIEEGDRTGTPPRLVLSPEQVEEQIKHLISQKREVEEALEELQAQRTMYNS